MNKNFPHVVAAFYGQPWAIHPAKLAEIETVLLRYLANGPMEFKAEESPRPRPVRTEEGYTMLGSAAIVPIAGTITPRPSLFAEYSGGSSYDRIGAAIDAAAKNASVDAIVLDIDSPGGYYKGLPEAAKKIADAKKAKPVIASVNHQAASAAYWLASQASEIAVAPSGEVGSVGVLAMHVDQTKLEEQMGIKTSLVVSKQAPFKTEEFPWVPLSENARAEMQRQVDQLGQEFIDIVAKGRGIRASVVEKDFGQGRMKLAEEAVAARMADRIATLETVVNEINGKRSKRNQRRVAADLAAMGFATNNP